MYQHSTRPYQLQEWYIAVTKINISPTWSKVKPKGFYVYIHSRASDGQPFYIGKGHGNRAFSRSGRNRHWNNVAKKHGVKVNVVKSQITEEESFNLERLFIKSFRLLGIKLCNKADGGEGASGVLSRKRKVVYCSNGMQFDHAKDAAKWLVLQGHTNATSKSISSACTGKKEIVYGYCWSYLKKPNNPIIPIGKTARTRNLGLVNALKVYCSNGNSYPSATEAYRKVMGKSGSGTHILECCNGNRKTAYGLVWAFKKSDIPKYECPHERSTRAKFIKIKCCNGMVFGSIKEATKWLENKMGRCISASAIHQSMKRGTPIGSYTFERISTSRGKKK